MFQNEDEASVRRVGEQPLIVPDRTARFGSWRGRCARNGRRVCEREPMKAGNGDISRSEWRLVAAVTALVLALSFAPSLYGLFHAPPGKTFLWTNELSARDQYTYLAWMEQSARGRLLTENPFTTEPHRRILFRPFLAAGGFLSRVPGVSLIGAWELMKLLSGAVLLFLIYRWIALFVRRPGERLAPFLVAAFSSGLGWLLAGPSVNSTDLWVPESITFLSIHQSPHFAASVALMLIVLITYHNALVRRSALAALPGGIAAFFLAWIHPFDIVTLGVLLSTWTAMIVLLEPAHRGAPIRAIALIALFALPVVARLRHLLTAEPVFRLWTESIHGESPPPVAYLCGFGLILPLAALGVRRLVTLPHRGNRACVRPLTIAAMPLIWIAVTTILVYAPFPFQRRLIQGVHIPLALLAGLGVNTLLDRFPLTAHRGGARIAALLVLVALLFPSNGAQIGRDFSAFAAGRAPEYLDTRYIDAFQWLRRETDPADAVLSSIQTGHFIPALAGNRVFLGHGELTVDSHNKMAAANRFFRGAMSPDEAEAFVRRTGVTYLFISPAEKMGDADWIGSWDRANRVYTNGLISIYRFD